MDQEIQVGDYLLKEVIGEGSFSIVKLCLHLPSGIHYACKIMPRDKIVKLDIMERFQTEIRVFQQMRHPGIVQLVDLLKDDQNYYVIMEHCPNGELFQYIVQRGRLEEKNTQVFIKQILLALQYIHKNGVSHRDLKPENILIDGSGNIKLTDFGLSKFVDKNNLVNTPCGSPCYVSPECISGKPYNGKQSDIWSCGVILYAMLTGQLPWTKRTQTALFKEIVSGIYCIPKHLSLLSRSLLLGMMCSDPLRRLTIEKALVHPWIASINVERSYNRCFHSSVSLKAVDLFFDEDTENPFSANFCDQKDMFSSTDLLSFGNTTKLMKKVYGLPKIETKTTSSLGDKKNIPIGKRSTMPNAFKQIGPLKISHHYSLNKKIILFPTMQQKLNI